MGVVFRRGQEMRRGDLALFLKSKDGTPKNAAKIRYEVFYVDRGVEVRIPSVSGVPMNSTIGEYFANFIIPLDADVGDYRIRWYFQEYQNSREVQVMNPFSVVQDATQVVCLPGATTVELDLVRSLRIQLRDNNPDRNYHFVPPAGEESINQFTRVFGYVWEDAEMLEYLKFALGPINLRPPETFFRTLDDLVLHKESWRSLLILGAMISALRALAINWIHEEFNYSIGGVSLSIEKASKYQSMMTDVQSQFDEMVVPAKETVKIIRGLRQNRFGMGIRSSFGPSVGRGSLTPRRFLGI
jgi:hypothetical protein